MGLKGGHLSTILLCTLQKLYKVSGLEPTGSIFLRCSTLKATDNFQGLKFVDLFLVVYSKI